MPITWRNIGAPETYSGNQLMNQGINHMNTGLGQLVAFGQQEQRNNINQQQAFETEQANVFQQQLMAMDDTEVMALQEQFQANPEAAIQQFGGQAETVFNALQQEPARREEQANAEFQREQNRVQRTTAPILEKAQPALQHLRIDPSNQESKAAITATIQELTDGGYHAQAQQLFAQKYEAMDAGEQRVFQRNSQQLSSRLNTIYQDVASGKMTQKDGLDEYEKLSEQYGQDVVATNIPYTEYLQSIEESAEQSGALMRDQRTILTGLNTGIEEDIAVYEEESNNLLERERTLNQQNAFTSLTANLPEGRTVADSVNNARITLQERTGKDGRVLNDYVKLFDSSLHAQWKVALDNTSSESGSHNLPTVLPPAVAEYATRLLQPIRHTLTSTGEKTANETEIKRAVQEAINTFVAYEQTRARIEEMELNHRQTLRQARQEQSVLNTELASRFQQDQGATISPEEIRELTRESAPTLARIRGFTIDDIPDATELEPATSTNQERVVQQDEPRAVSATNQNSTNSRRVTEINTARDAFNLSRNAWNPFNDSNSMSEYFSTPLGDQATPLDVLAGAGGVIAGRLLGVGEAVENIYATAGRGVRNYFTTPINDSSREPITEAELIALRREFTIAQIEGDTRTFKEWLDDTQKR